MRRRAWLLHGAGTLIALLVCAAYSNGLRCPFVYDDLDAIVGNSSLRRLTAALAPPAGTSVSGRPLLNLSFAANYAAGGLDVFGYHVTNILIHVGAALTLFGVLRRTLRGDRALWAAFLIALLWAVHPLQTEAVTYVIQRAESLMGLFYLLTLYCAIRAMETKSWGWKCLSVASCLCGVGTKEVIVSAPVLVLAYDRTFAALSVREAWRQRRFFYSALFATWIPLIILAGRGGGNRNGTAGFNLGISPWAYWLTQFRAIGHYLRLAVWPHPLVFDYGLLREPSWPAILPFAAFSIGLAGVTVYGLWRRAPWGFAGLWFFAVLAPTSLVPGTTQMIVEHRMYLALAPVIAVAALACFAGFRRIGPGGGGAWLAALGAVAVVFCIMTHERNRDYASAGILWGDTVAKRPESSRARVHYAFELAKTESGLPGAVEQYQAALRLDPSSAETEVNLANVLARISGRRREALAHYRSALRLEPSLAQAHYDLATLLADSPGTLAEAIEEFEAALRLKPDFGEAEVNLANALATANRLPEAMVHYETALRLRPNDFSAHFNVANVLATIPGQTERAILHYRKALQLSPGPSEADLHNRLGVLLARGGDTAGGAEQFAAALRCNPAFAEAHNNYGNVFHAAGRIAEAKAEYEAAVRFHPGFAVAEMNLGGVLFELGNLPEAEAACRAALRLDPRLQRARDTLARILEAERARSAR